MKEFGKLGEKSISGWSEGIKIGKELDIPVML
jgi:hypothetical protein